MNKKGYKVVNPVFILLCLLLSGTAGRAQDTRMCAFVGEVNQHIPEIVELIDSSMVLRDSLSYTITNGQYLQNDPSEIILPDSCTIVLLFDIKYAYMSKPDSVYLLIIDKLAAFNETMTRNYIVEVLQELILTKTFVSDVAGHAGLKHLPEQLLACLAFQAPGSEVEIKLKKWLRQHPEQKESEFYKKLSEASTAKK